MTKKILLMVDVQNDFCPGGALAVNNGNKVVEPLNKMVKYAKENNWLIVASRDWHPAITRHFKNHGGIWPTHCVQNTDGAKFHPELHVSEAMVVSKATQPNEDGYSAFDGKIEDGRTLAAFLRANKIEEVYVGGLATDYCVKASALDSTKNGFKTYLLIDTCKAVNLQPDDGDKAIDEMEKARVLVTTTKEVINE